MCDRNRSHKWGRRSGKCVSPGGILLCYYAIMLVGLCMLHAAGKR